MGTPLFHKNVEYIHKQTAGCEQVDTRSSLLAFYWQIADYAFVMMHKKPPAGRKQLEGFLLLHGPLWYGLGEQQQPAAQHGAMEAAQ